MPTRREKTPITRCDQNDSNLERAMFDVYSRTTIGHLRWVFPPRGGHKRRQTQQRRQSAPLAAPAAPRRVIEPFARTPEGAMMTAGQRSSSGPREQTASASPIAVTWRPGPQARAPAITGRSTTVLRDSLLPQTAWHYITAIGLARNQHRPFDE